MAPRAVRFGDVIRKGLLSHLPQLSVLFLLFILSMDKLMTRSLFMDGLFYATMARNMAEGMGSLWDPILTETYYSHFRDHPPLAFWSAQWPYRLLGDHYLVDKLICLVIAILTLLGIHRIWNHSDSPNKTSWWPMLLWSITPLVFWSIGNFMLESFMMLYVLAAILCLLAHERGHRLWIWAVGPLLLLSCLNKAVVGLFPLAWPLIRMLVDPDYRWSSCVLHSGILLLGLLASAGFVVLVWPEALMYAQEYYTVQLEHSLSSVVTVDSRFWLIQRFFSESIPMLALVLILYFVARKQAPSMTRRDRQLGLRFFLLSLSSVLPLMVSMKQRGFYLLPGLLLLAIALAFFSRASLQMALIQMSAGWKSKAQIWTASLFLTVVIGMGIYHYGRPGRYAPIIEDTDLIGQVLGEGAIADAHPSVVSDFSLYGYLYRDHHISLHRSVTGTRFLISSVEAEVDEDIYMKVEIDTQRYRLWSKKVEIGK